MTDNIDNIPVWDENQPEKSFVTLSNPTNENIPATRLESWKDFSKFLENPFFDFNNVQHIFRGHRRYDWKLTPTLARILGNGILSEELVKEQWSTFRKTMRAHATDYSLLEIEKENNELWSIGQHHGLMTPLLDWTHSPYVALFFAFSEEDKLNEEKENLYRAIYILNKNSVVKSDSCKNVLFEPKKDSYKRLVSQDGLFTISPPGLTTTGETLVENLKKKFPPPNILAKHICKVYIKNEQQRDCLEYLRHMNIHHASLFPDIFGASNYCNALIIKKQRTKNSSSSTKQDQHSEKSIRIEKIRDLLTNHLKKEDSNPSRVALLANELCEQLSKLMFINWQGIDAVKREMKRVTSVLLRIYDYPIYARSEIIENILYAIDTKKKS